MKTYPFNALVSRMKYIRRWSLMHAARPETLSEHTAETAILAPHPVPDRAAGHRHSGAPRDRGRGRVVSDAPEILTGDMPTPVKIQNERIHTAYKALETESAVAMLGLFAARPAPAYGRLCDRPHPHRGRVPPFKAADRLSALIKCIEEVQAGNREFAAALEQQKTALAAMHCPEADYFLERMLPCYSQNLDELTQTGD